MKDAPSESNRHENTAPGTLGRLCQIFIDHEGYLSDKWEHYLFIYEAALARFVPDGRPVRLLEIGVQNGGSLQIWSKYLPKGSALVGIDIDNKCAELVTAPNVSMYIGDATDPVWLGHALGDSRFDVIIDDGSHRSDDIVASFEACFPRLDAGGTYIVEDLHCSYFASHGGGFRRPGAAMEWFKGLADALNVDHFESDGFEKLDSTSLERLRDLGRQIACISFFDSVVLIQKLASEKEQPYRRIMTGQEARVVDIATQVALLPTPALRTLLLPPSTAASFAPALLNAVASAREEVGQLRSALDQAAARHEGEMHAAETRRAEEAAQRTDAEKQAATERELAQKRLTAAAEKLAAQEAELVNLRSRAATAEAERDSLRQERDALLSSTFWRFTGPARKLAAVLPQGLRQQGRRGASFVYRLLTPHRTGERLAHFRLQERIAKEPPPWADFFDAEWYAERYRDVTGSGLAPLEHFVHRGASERRDPNPAFDTAWYLETNRDVASAGAIAIEHFVLWGAEEGRVPFKDFDFDLYRQQAEIPRASNLDTYRHYLQYGRAAGLSPFVASSITDDLADRLAIVPTYEELFAKRFGALQPLHTYEAPCHCRRVTIVTDSINSGSLYGGVATAIILGALLARRLGGDLRLVTRTEPPVAENIGIILRTNNVPWTGNVECLHSPPGAGGRDVPMSRQDLFLTTSWWTTRAVRGAVPPAQIVYMLGEDERMFYPLGDEHLLCTETLSDPSLLYVVNSSVLLRHLRSEGMAPGGIAFEPAFPSVTYYVERPPEEQGRRRFFFYARPNNLRNLYWRGIAAIAAAVEEGVLGPEQWDFYFVGKDAPELVLPRGVRPRVMHDLPWPEYAALVRRIDVGLSLMYTPHPSYPPLDLAASGAVVVTNRFGPKADMSNLSRNILCVEPRVSALVAGLRQAVMLAEDPATRAANATQFGMPRDWVTALAPLLDYVAARCPKV
jgi:Methyltransferase domain